MYRIAVAITILGTVMYHLAQKMTSRTVNPFLSLAVTYLVALAACLVVLAVSGREALSWPGLRQLNWASVACGGAVLLIEIGVLMAYRSGWNLKTLALVANTAVALALFPIGLVMFREKLDMGQAVGIVLCIGGLVLLLR
jgi:uncharacterized membrane protein